jgi:acyl-CoA synthetase (NDP forming)
VELSARDLSPLLAPESVAVVGASDDPGKWGNGIARAVLESADVRRVHLVNHRQGEVLGRPAHASLRDLPEPVDCAVVVVPAGAFEAVIEDGLAAGVRSFIGITTGLGERDGAGRAAERAIVERLRAAGSMLLGTNCMGVWVARSRLNAAWIDPPPGRLAIVSQSGALGVDLARQAHQMQLGLSHFVSVGNQSDITIAEVVRACAHDDSVGAIGVYCEDFVDGRAFLRSVEVAAGQAKPVVVLAPGGGPAARAAASHTGSMLSDARVVRSLLADAGAALVATPEELMETAQLLLAPHRPRGRRVAVVSDGGGMSVIASGVLATEELEVPELSAAARAAVLEQRPEAAGTANPVDLTGVLSEFEVLGRVTRTLLDSGEVDTTVLAASLGFYTDVDPERTDEVEAAHHLAAQAAAAGKPVVVVTPYPELAPAAALRGHDVPVFRGVGAACRALGTAVRLAGGPRRPVPALPVPDAQAPDASYFGARGLLAAAGVPFPEAREARSRDEVLQAAAEIGYPVVLKALAASHKSEGGGVAVGLADAGALAAAADGMRARLDPPSYSVEACVDGSGAVELICGIQVEPRFGPVLLVGLGGMMVELLEDAVLGIAPVDPGEAADMLARLRGFPLLDGHRGRDRLDVAAAADAIAAISACAAGQPDVAELEVNPLLVLREGVMALDARIVPRTP